MIISQIEKNAGKESILQQKNEEQCYNQVHTAIDRLQSTADTGNTTIDSILSYGMKKASRYGVLLQTKIWISSSLNIPASDLFVIMGNTIDNAIEASAALPEKDRIVTIDLSPNNHLLNYEIQNAYAGKQCKEGQIHGYGLRNVKTCIEKNGDSAL